MNRGFGVSALIDRDFIPELAATAEAHGYSSFWVNDVEGANGLEQLARAQTATSKIRLGVGVLPVDRWSNAEVTKMIARLHLESDRLTLGIGAGTLHEGSLEAVRALAIELDSSTSARVLIGALGPKMCALAGEVADGVLLNWLTPDVARETGNLTIAAANAAKRPKPEVTAYVRTAASPDAASRLERESSSYEGYPSYKRHFDRMGVRAVETAVNGTGDEISTYFDRFESIADEVVARAIVGTESLEAYLQVLIAAAPKTTS